MYEGNAGILLMYFAKMDDVVLVKCHNSMSKVAALLDISDVFDDILVYSNNKMEWFSYKGCCSVCV